MTLVYNCSYFLHDRLSVTQYALLVSVLFLIFVVFFFKKICFGYISALGLGMFALGGGYNLLVKIIRGCVADYIDLGISYINFADLVIFVGLFLMLLGHIICLKRSKI